MSLNLALRHSGPQDMGISLRILCGEKEKAPSEREAHMSPGKRFHKVPTTCQTSF